MLLGSVMEALALAHLSEVTAAILDGELRLEAKPIVLNHGHLQGQVRPRLHRHRARRPCRRAGHC